MDDARTVPSPPPADGLAADPVGASYGDAGPVATVRGWTGAKVVVAVFVALAAWGVLASADNAGDGDDGVVSRIGTSGGSSVPFTSGGSSSAGSLPLGPIGEASCRSAVAQAKSYIPDAIADAQSGVDDLIAEHPELAAYAADAKRMLAQSAPQAEQYLTDAGNAIGC